VPVLALLLWFRLGLGIQSISGLVGAGAAMVVVFGLTGILFVYRNDPYLDLPRGLARLRAWGRV